MEPEKISRMIHEPEYRFIPREIAFKQSGIHHSGKGGERIYHNQGGAGVSTSVGGIGERLLKKNKKTRLLAS